MDVIVGDYNPTGKMPITLPKNDEVIAVNADGVCISPNDVPGYLKDQYMPEEMKDRNGKAYAYRDSENNYYELNYGLSYEESEKPHRPSRPNSSNASSGGSAAPATGNSGAVTGTWSVREDGQWTFKTSGGVTPASCWQYINWNGTNNWYYFNADGSMAVGWISGWTVVLSPQKVTAPAVICIQDGIRLMESGTISIMYPTEQEDGC